MKSTKKLGIWMDHSNAHLMALTHDSVTTNIVNSKSESQEKIENLRRDESLMQNREQNQLSDFFKRLSLIIMDYDEVLLFGPTDAKNELLNLLKDNRHFEKVKIEAKTAGNMTENQEEAFVIKHFNASD